MLWVFHFRTDEHLMQKRHKYKLQQFVGTAIPKRASSNLLISTNYLSRFSNFRYNLKKQRFYIMVLLKNIRQAFSDDISGSCGHKSSLNQSFNCIDKFYFYSFFFINHHVITIKTTFQYFVFCISNSHLYLFDFSTRYLCACGINRFMYRDAQKNFDTLWSMGINF